MTSAIGDHDRPFPFAFAALKYVAMKVGIIGSGDVAKALDSGFQKRGHDAGSPSAWQYFGLPPF